ncbi:DUF5723 family protein [Pontibacter liquoris]|uniref:DUF5723 family protein n=1 Tax=Pontibacter liquoris TaxID=2905677 RepID=UPI001FA8114C|nr:DUF5723 family protein [Pontibacter liquoris]
MKKTFLLAAALLVAQASAWAQTEFSSFSAVGRGGVMNTFVHDYQALGVNPANLGRSTSLVAFTVLEGGIGASTQALTKDTFRKFTALSGYEDLTLEDRRNMARAFTSDNVLNAGADLNTFAISVNLPKIGGFAFSNRQRMLTHVAFNKNFAELVFLGNDAEVYDQFQPDETVFVSQLFEGTEVKASWVNEWNVAYGRKIIDLPLLNIYGGAGYKYLQGLALYEFSAHSGKVNAYRASSPILDWDYEGYLDNPDFNYKDPDGLLSPVGKGHGFDAGLSAEIVKIVKVGVSVTDMGKMSWTQNLLQGEDKGFKLPNNPERAQEYSFEDAADVMKTIVDSAIVFTPVNELTTSLPTKLRAGVGVKLGKIVEVGVDYVHPLNNAPGNITQDFVGLGVDVMPIPFIRLSTGVSSGAGDKVNLPIGFAIVTPVYEFGISTRDITAPFTRSNPGITTAMGFLRFKIGKPHIL